MQICAQCKRHVRNSDSACPFCGAACAPLNRASPTYAGFAARSVLIASVAAGAMACKDAEQPPMAVYGAPPSRDSAEAPQVGPRTSQNGVTDAGAPDANARKVPMDIYGAPPLPPSANPSANPSIPTPKQVSAPIYGGPPPRKGH
jgi:hypothetical protein